MYSDRLSAIHFWGWQLVIVTAALTLPLGFTTSKEYAELEWPIDLLITGVWVTFGWNMIGTILRRRERHMYVSIWFYLATFLTVALLHVVNSLELPVSFLKSYSMYAGVQDALVQWWYGHNAVAFFLTTPFLGLMYYFVPKAANRPVFSYRLSIVHFWSLIFLYIWAGPHHLLYTALPDWAQSLGTVFSIMLIAPSWGGMVNGLLTLRGAWDRVREDPVLKFMVVGITAYGMATFEGPMLSLKSVNALTHYTDYIIGHVHVGALAWNGGLSFATLYYVMPRIYRHEAVLAAARQPALLAGDARDPLLRDSDVCRRHHPEPDVAGVHGRRRAALPELPRDGGPAEADVHALRAGRRHRSSCSARWSRSTTSIARPGREASWPTSRPSRRPLRSRRPTTATAGIGGSSPGPCSSRC